jgi:hypothetical protein
MGRPTADPPKPACNPKEEGETMENRRSAGAKIQAGTAIFALFSLVLLVGTCAWAQAPGACADEIAQFCSGISAGGGALRQCLLEHDNELSGWCRSSIARARDEAADACHDDAILLCAGAGGGTVQCLKDKESWLSFECKVKLGLLPENQSR